MARIYRRGTWRADTEDGRPIPYAQATVWTAPTGGSQVTDLLTLEGDPIPGGILDCDAWGYLALPGFVDPNDNPELYIIGSPDGVIPGVARVYLQPGDHTARITSLTGQQAATAAAVHSLETSIGQPNGVAPLDSSGLVPTEHLPAVAAGVGTYNVRTYGAVGDGTTDDAPAIQAALDACAAAGGGQVIIPPGTYNVSYRVAIGPNTRVTAYGAYIHRLNGGPLIANFRGSDSYGGYDGPGNIIIEGGTWDHRGSQHTSASNAINFNHASRILVRDVTVLDVYSSHALEFNAVQNARVENCRFFGFVDPGGRQFAEAIQIDVAKSGSASIPDYDGTPCDDILIRGCITGPSGTPGTSAWGCLVGSHTVDAAPHTRIRVESCVVYDCVFDGVRAYGWQDSIIRDVIVYSAGRSGVRIQAPTGMPLDSILVDGCHVEHTAQHAIYAEGLDGAPITGLRIHGCRVPDTAGGNHNAIRVDWAPDAVVSDCQIGATDATAIYVVDSPRALITGISVSHAGSNGINVTRCERAMVRACQVRDTASYGILLSASTRATIVGCVVTGAGRNGSTLSALRISSAGSDYCYVTGCQVHPAGGTETTRAWSVDGRTGNAVVNNDFRGFGSEAASHQDGGTGTIKSGNLYA